MVEGRTLGCDIAVVGGGVVGLAVAYGLAGRGLSVTVLDEGDVAHRASRGNFALVWVQGKGVDHPEYARWTLASARAWDGFARELGDETGIDLAYTRNGGLAVCLAADELDSRAAGMRRLHNTAPDCAEVEVLDHVALRALLPGVGDDAAGGTFCRHDGHVNSLRLFRALHGALLLRRGRYIPNAAVSAIETVAGSFSLETAAGRIQARKVVLAAGLANARLAPMVGLRAPVRPQRGQIMVTEKLAPLLPLPMSTLRQTDEGGIMIGDSNEEVGPDDRNAHAVLAEIAARAVRVLPALGAAQVVRAWGALRVMSPDGYPIYDRSTVCPGAYLVTCHSGVTLAAAHASTIAGAIAGDAWPAAVAPFGAGRFGDVPAAA
jgi:glycine/D-amino acid oxidase-like deaminating enzyme